MPKWNDEYYVLGFELAKSGLSDQRLAKFMGITVTTLKQWRAKRKAFNAAIERGRKFCNGKSTMTFREYVYQRLSPRLQELWDKINECEDAPSGVARLEALLEKHGKSARQHLFLYALTSSNFNASEACRKVNIARQTMEQWVEDDPDFAALLQEVDWHKQNFFESSLVALVASGDPSATIFANRTYNRKRGYGEKTEVEMTGRVEHEHIVSVRDLNLPLETRLSLLQAIRQRQTAVIEATPSRVQELPHDSTE